MVAVRSKSWPVTETPQPAAPAQVRNILADVKAGETLIPLRELSDESFIPRKRGKRPHPSRWFRWAANGLRGVRLETLNAPSLCTTRSAVLRFYAALSGGGAALPTAGALRRQRELTDRELDAAGIA